MKFSLSRLPRSAALVLALCGLAASSASAAEPAGPALSGDFNGDGVMDLAIVVSGDESPRIELLLSVESESPTHVVTSVPAWMSLEGLVPLVGDFDGDQRHDLAFQRPGHLWTSLPVLFAGDGSSWDVRISSVGSWVHDQETRVAIGDTDGDGRDELALWRPGTDAASALLEINSRREWAEQEISPASGPGPVALLMPRWEVR